MKHRLLKLAAVAALTSTAPASAATFLFSGTLSGANSVPANMSNATGTFSAILDDVANSLTVAVAFSNLSAPATAAHIHCCVLPNANGPVVLPFTGFPAATSGSYTNVFTGLSSTNVNGIKSGLAYINIHNVNFPGGEIRGNLAAVAGAVPETATWGMMIAGFGVVGAAMRQRRRARALAA